MELKDTLAPLNIELKKIAALGGSMTIVVVPLSQAEQALRAKREMDTAITYAEYLIIGVFGLGADEASAQFLSIPKGIAVYPQDGTDIQALFFDALERFNINRGGSPWVKSLWESIREMKSSDTQDDPDGKYMNFAFHQLHAFMADHPDEVGLIVSQVSPTDRHWIEDPLPFGVVSALKGEGMCKTDDISSLIQQWGYEERLKNKHERARSTMRKLRNIEHLFTLPSISQEIIMLAGDSMVAASKMAKIIEKDPVLTSRLLKVVNSAFYGFRRQIISVEHAVVILGNDEVINLAFSIAVHQIMTRIAPKHGRLLWDHSLMVAHLAHWLGPLMGATAGNALYTLGLLHDFGKIIFLQKGYAMGDISQMSSLENLSIEEKQTGISHAEMGAYVAERWNLPEDIVDGLLCHHLPAKAKDLSMAVTVHLADVIAHKRTIAMDELNCAAARYLSTEKRMHLSEEAVAKRFEETESRVKVLLDT